ncbi:hypothetical protein BC829DRAFT_409826, partial [Chytridium lagenaria]
MRASFTIEVSPASKIATGAVVVTLESVVPSSVEITTSSTAGFFEIAGKTVGGMIEATAFDAEVSTIFDITGGNANATCPSTPSFSTTAIDGTSACFFETPGVETGGNANATYPSFAFPAKSNFRNGLDPCAALTGVTGDVSDLSVIPTILCTFLSGPVNFPAILPVAFGFRSDGALSVAEITGSHNWDGCFS